MYGSLGNPEDFGTIFLNEEYEKIYYCTSPDFENGNSIRIRFKDGNEPIQGDTIVNTQANKDPFDEKMDKSLTMIDFILLIPRAIALFFKY